MEDTEVGGREMTELGHGGGQEVKDRVHVVQTTN